MTRWWILFKARNKEFWRDRSALAWNFIFPFFIILGFSFIFDRDDKAMYKMGVVNAVTEGDGGEGGGEGDLRDLPFVETVTLADVEEGLSKLAHHKLDIVVDPGTVPPRYWVSETSPASYMAERLLLERLRGPDSSVAERHTVTGSEIPYLDWLFPGVLGMNIMFSALFGVGYVVVRYRKNGVLKRLSVTPLNAFEFLSAQLGSRMFLLMGTTAILYVVCVPLFGFENHGSEILLWSFFFWGSASMVALGLLVAARTSSEELAGGLLNLFSWPMMILCEVWFSLEGASDWIRGISLAMPLTHMVVGARAVMNDGAGFAEVGHHLVILMGLTGLFLLVGSWAFRWEKR